VKGLLEGMIVSPVRLEGPADFPELIKCRNCGVWFKRAEKWQVLLSDGRTVEFP
jgi:hypothetical protein